MIATTEQKARLLDIATGVLELVRDGNRDIQQVSAVFQMVKDDPSFYGKLFGKLFPRRFEVWKTITIGGVSKDELVMRLGDGFDVSDWAKDIMSKPEFVTASKPHEVSLTRVKVRDLGFKEAPTTTELFARIKEVGDLCPAEVGSHLRLVDKDQPKNTWYWVAMEPITDSDGDPHIDRKSVV